MSFFSNLFKSKKKKEITNNHSSFDVEESVQSYKLRDYGYLYESPKDNFLSLYKQLYDNVPVLDGAINAYTDLICSGWKINSDDPKEAEFITNELKKTNFDKTLKTILDDYFIYGYYGAEIVPSKKFDKIEKFQEIPTEELRLDRDDYGNIIEFIQETARKIIKINPKMILFSANRESTNEPYGRSLFRSLPWITRIMLEMQDSMSKIYRRYGSPRFHVTYTPAIQLDQNVLNDRLTKLKKKFKDIEIGQDFFTAGDVAINMIGAGGKEQFKLTIEMEEIMQSMFSGLKLPAGVLGYNYGSTETHLNKQIEILLGRILSYQKEQAHVINLKLMPLIATIYNLKNLPIFEFEKPIITDESTDLELETKRINNIKSLIEMNMITTADGQQKLGLEVKDIKASPKQKEEDPNA